MKFLNSASMITLETDPLMMPCIPDSEILAILEAQSVVERKIIYWFSTPQAKHEEDIRVTYTERRLHKPLDQLS